MPTPQLGERCVLCLVLAPVMSKHRTPMTEKMLCQGSCLHFRAKHWLGYCMCTQELGRLTARADSSSRHLQQLPRSAAVTCNPPACSSQPQQRNVDTQQSWHTSLPSAAASHLLHQFSGLPVKAESWTCRWRKYFQDKHVKNRIWNLCPKQGKVWEDRFPFQARLEGEPQER